MPVVRIENGEVVQLWRDVATVAEAVERYGLDPSTLVEADYPPGTLFVNSRFQPPAPGTPLLPEQVSKLHLIRALRAAGHWADVKAALAAADEATREDWEAASAIRRDDPLVASFADALGVSEAERDAIFIQAARL